MRGSHINDLTHTILISQEREKQKAAAPDDDEFEDEDKIAARDSIMTQIKIVIGLGQVGARC